MYLYRRFAQRRHDIEVVNVLDVELTDTSTELPEPKSEKE
jgi:hypothetical protein